MGIKETATGIASLGGARLLAAVLSFGATTLVARELGPAELGIFSVVAGWYAYVSLLGEFGLRSVVVTETSRLGRVDTLLRRYLKIRLSFSLLSYLLAVSITSLFYPSYLLVVAIMMASVFFFPFILDWVLIVFKNYPLSGWATVSRWIAYATLVGVCAVVGKLSLHLVAILFTCSWALGALATIFLAKKQGEPLFGAEQTEKPTSKQMLNLGWPILFSNLILQLHQNADLLWIGAFRASEDAGHYFIATAIITAAFIPVNALCQIVLSRYAAIRDKAELQKELRKDTFLIFATGVLISAGFVACAPLIPMVFGSEYNPSANILLYFVAQFLGSHIFYLYQTFCISQGYQRLSSKALLLTVPFIPLAYIFAEMQDRLEAYALAKAGLVIISMLFLLRVTPANIRASAIKTMALPLAVTVILTGVLFFY